MLERAKQIVKKRHLGMVVCAMILVNVCNLRVL